MAATLALTSRAHEYYTLSHCETVPKSREFEPFFPKHTMQEDADGSSLHSVLSRLEIVEPLNRRALGKLKPIGRGERPRLTRADLCKFVVPRTAQEL